VKSFPRYIGIRASNSVSAVFYICAIALSFLPFFLESYGVYFLNMFYFVPVFICDTLLLSTSVQLLVKKKVNMSFLRKFTLFALFIGLLAFLAGAFTG
jgi:4-hydroxybenzoate polyprenyltransferase